MESDLDTDPMSKSSASPPAKLIKPEIDVGEGEGDADELMESENTADSSSLLIDESQSNNPRRSPNISETTAPEPAPGSPTPIPLLPKSLITDKENAETLLSDLPQGEPQHDDTDNEVREEDEEPKSPTPESIEVQVRKRLIAEVSKYPNIWKYGHPNYRHWGETQESWERISEAVAMPLEECRQIWNRVRARYATSRTLSLKTKSKLRYFKNLSFLEQNFQSKSNSQEDRASRRKNRKIDFINYTNLLEPDTLDGSGYSTNFMNELSDFEDGPGPKDAKDIFLDQLQHYEKDQKLCILCNRKTNEYETKLFRECRKNPKNSGVVREWKRSKVLALCELLGLSSGGTGNSGCGSNYAEFLIETSFCKTCHQLILDVEMWSKTVKTLNLKLDRTKRQIEEILIKSSEKLNLRDTSPESAAVPDINLSNQLELDTQIQHQQTVKLPKPFVIGVNLKVKEEAVTDHEAENSEVEGNFIVPDRLDEHLQVKSKKSKKPVKKDKKSKIQAKTSRRKAVVTRSGRRVQPKQEYSDSESEFEELESSLSSNPKDEPENDQTHPNKTPLKKRKINLESIDSDPPEIPKPSKKQSLAPIRYYCKEPNCKYSCKSEYLVQVHVNKDHLSQAEPFHCDCSEDLEPCEKKFKTVGLLNIHKIRDHGDNANVSSGGKKSCKYCGKIFGSRGLSQHMEQQHSEYQLKPKCTICLKAFKRQSEVVEHEELHRTKLVDQFTCVLCEGPDCIYQDKLELQRHVLNSHEQGLFKCFPCDIIFLTKNRLRHHMYRHHSRDSRPELKCPHCDFQAQQPSSLKYHLQKHAVSSDFKCDFPGCGSSYKWLAALKRHKLSHTDLKPFECNICGKKFHQGSYLRRHQVYHLDLRPFMCEICSSSYKTKKHLNRHMKSHEKDPLGSKPKNSKPRKARLQQITATIKNNDEIENYHDETVEESGAITIIQEHPNHENTTVLQVMEIVDASGAQQFAVAPEYGTFVQF